MDSRDPVELWVRPVRSAAGPKPSHTREALAETAIKIADNHGLRAASIRRVAAEIGAGPASLYRYVKSHDELLELMMDTVSAEYDLSLSGEPPIAQMLNLAKQGRTLMHRHTWLAPLLLTRPSLGPNSLRYLERSLSALESVDMPGPAKLTTVAMMTAMTSAFVQNELAAASGAQDSGSEARTQYLSSVVQSGDYPLLADSLADRRAVDGADQVFAGVVTSYLVGAGVPCLSGLG